MPLRILAPSNSSSLDPVAAAQGGSDRHSNALMLHLIAKLPIELLEQIFLEHARDTYQPGSIYTDVKAHHLRPEWIDATYVCRLWREICLHSPRLWTCINTTFSRKWILTFLERSRKQPLIINLMIDHLHIDDLHAVFSTNTYRIKELYIGIQHLDTDARLNQCWNVLTDSAPLLESLIIDTLVNPYEIPDTLFSRDTPRLRRLGLDCGTAVGPTSPLLGNLHHLNIQTAHVGQLLTVLQKIPFLESLEVRMPTEMPYSELPATVLHLPHLSWLYIEAEYYGNMIALFKRLQMPSTVRVQFHASTLAEKDNDSYRMLNTTRDCFQWIHEALGHLYVVFDIKAPRRWYMAC